MYTLLKGIPFNTTISKDIPSNKISNYYKLIIYKNIPFNGNTANWISSSNTKNILSLASS